MADNKITFRINNDSCAFYMVDDGDNIFHSNRPDRDYLESQQGHKIDESNPCVKDFLQKFGLRSFHGMRVREFSEFIDAWERAKSSLKRGPANEESAWKLYSELRTIANKKIGHYFASSENFIKTFMKDAGPGGCYVPLRIADEHANTGYVEEMDSSLNLAGQCSVDRKLSDESFVWRMGKAKITGYRTAANASLVEAKKAASKGWKTEMNTAIKRIEELSKAVGILDDFKNGIVDVRKSYVQHELAAALTNANKGWKDEMNANLKDAAEVAAQGGLSKIFEVGALEVRLAYLKCKFDKAKEDARKGWKDEMNTHLKDAAEIATQGGLSKNFEAGAAEVRMVYVLSEFERAKVDANKGWKDEMNVRLKNAAEVAAQSGLSKVYEEGAAGVRTVYIQYEFAEAKKEAKKGWKDEMNKRLESALNVAELGRIRNVFDAGAVDVRRTYVVNELARATADAKKGWKEDMNKRLKNALEVAAQGGIRNEYEAGAVEVRTTYIELELTKAAEALKKGWLDDVLSHADNAEEVAKEGKILDKFMARIESIRRSIKK